MRPQPTLEPGDAELASGIASILLVAGGPVRFSALASSLDVPRSRVPGALQFLAASLEGGIRLQLGPEEAQLVTAPENAAVVQRFLGAAKPPPLSRPALETLAIVAYEQPVTRADIERIRGVGSDRTVQTLLARGLVEEIGRRETAGRPTEYGTTFGFLEYFGLSSLAELPPLEVEELPHTDAAALGMRADVSGEPTVD